MTWYVRLFLTTVLLAALAVPFVQSPPSVLADDPVELTGQRTRNSKIYDLGGGQYRVEASISSVHYQDESGEWLDIEPTILESDWANWDWEVNKGAWTLLIREDTTVAVGKDGHWIGFKHNGMAYLDRQSNQYQLLQSPQAVTPVVEGNKISWPGIYYGATLEYIYTPDGFKENLVITQQTRDWLTANPPSSFGLNNATSYFGGYLEMDWVNAYPAKYLGVDINWQTGFELLEGRIDWNHPVTQKIVSALPLGAAIHPETGESSNLTYRFYNQNDTNYLIFGGKVTELNQLPLGTIVIDPTIYEQIDSDLDDGMTYNGNWYSQNYLRYNYNNVTSMWAGLRWPLAIPQGATITSANFSVYCNYATDDDFISEIYGDDTDNASPMESGTLLENRTRTTASDLTWNETGTGVGYVTTPLITDIVQEVINRDGWASGNYFSLIFRDVQSAVRSRAADYAGDPTHAAAITVVYTSGGAADIANTPETQAYGVQEPSATANTGLTKFNVVNSSGFAIDITIQGTDALGGNTFTLSDTATPGADTFGMKAGLSGGSYNVTIPKSSAAGFIYSLADSANQSWGLQLIMPTSHSDGVEKTANVTLEASAS